MSQSEFTSFLQHAEEHRTIPVIKTYKLDTLTPIQLFNALKDKAVYILESSDQESDWSNFSFIGLNPVYTITEKNDVFTVKGTDGSTVYSENSLSGIFRYLDRSLQLKQPDIPIPFKGGAVGYIGYDAVSLFEKVKKHPARLEEETMCSLFICRSYLAFDHAANQLYCIEYAFLDGRETERELLDCYTKACESISSLITQVNSSSPLKDLFLDYSGQGTVSFDRVNSNMSKEAFLEKVGIIQDYIASGDVFQAVLSQRFKVPIRSGGFELYRILRKVNPSPYLFYLNYGDTEIAGSSPERLIHVQNGHLEIHPIAGTRRRGKDEEEDRRLAADLLADEKEKAEHLMLVDLARNDIGRVADYHSVKTENYMELTRFSHVMHLLSKVTGRLREDVHPADALAASFPAGTVSGAPKVRAMEILRELEPTPRDQYAGCIAYIGFDGSIDSCIAIRTAVIKNGIAHIQAGAGIVADSVPENEWEETRSKASALIKAIEMANDQFGKEAEYEEHSIKSR